MTISSTRGEVLSHADTQRLVKAQATVLSRATHSTIRSANHTVHAIRNTPEMARKLRSQLRYMRNFRHRSLPMRRFMYHLRSSAIQRYRNFSLAAARKRIQRLHSNGKNIANASNPSSLVPCDADAQSQIVFNTPRLAIQALRYEKQAFKTGARSAYKTARMIRNTPATIRRLINRIRNATRFVIHAVMNITATIVSSVIPLLISVLPIIVILTLILGLFSWACSIFSSQHTSVVNVPSQYQAILVRAGNVCTEISPSLLAAQVQQESGFNPQAKSPSGAQGISQFMPATWNAHGLDGDNDGKADVFNPIDAIWSQGNYMCSIAHQIDTLVKNNRISGDITSLTLAAYNSGLGTVEKYHGIPPFKETQEYVKNIEARAQEYETNLPSDSITAGRLQPPLRISNDRKTVDIAAMGIIPRSTSYEVYQCTWWVDIRRNQLHRKTYPYMGNAADWVASARRMGWILSDTPDAGDVIVFDRGVHGSSSQYGHVAVVEQVMADGSILISQSGTGFGRVVVEQIPAYVLHMISHGIHYIY